MARSSTTYQPNWKSGKTTVVRVPEVLSEQVLEYARDLDSAEGSVVEEPVQAYFRGFSEVDRSKPINVSKVVHRSPFRYPGGKTWFVPYLRQWLLSHEKQPALFVEPFCGGAISSMTVALENWARHILMADLDERISSVWQTILWGQADWLSQRIEEFPLTHENVKKEFEREQTGGLQLRERAFITILRNRVQRGGIMAAGAGLVKAGENGKGLSSRWYPETLSKRIQDIAASKEKISFECACGLQLMQRLKYEEDAVFFIDPPYTKAAKRLYSHWEFDHERLFQLAESLAGDIIMTYDNTQEIKELATAHGFQTAEVAMKNTHHAKMTELIIGKNLQWLDPDA